jgi:hypothetical protein
MAFPELRPTSRDFSPGDWPTKRFNAQSGTEIRILYGSQRTNAKLSLTYTNITNVSGQLFLDDYNSTYGTLRTFTLPSVIFTGWPNTTGLNAPPGTRWRYETEPKIQHFYAGRCSVSIELIAVA